MKELPTMDQAIASVKLLATKLRNLQKSLNDGAFVEQEGLVAWGLKAETAKTLFTQRIAFLAMQGQMQAVTEEQYRALAVECWKVAETFVLAEDYAYMESFKNKAEASALGVPAASCLAEGANPLMPAPEAVKTELDDSAIA